MIARDHQFKSIILWFTIRSNLHCAIEWPSQFGNGPRSRSRERLFDVSVNFSSRCWFEPVLWIIKQVNRTNTHTRLGERTRTLSDRGGPHERLQLRLWMETGNTGKEKRCGNRQTGRRETPESKRSSIICIIKPGPVVRNLQLELVETWRKVWEHYRERGRKIERGCCVWKVFYIY